jgi:hypothetical protein
METNSSVPSSSSWIVSWVKVLSAQRTDVVAVVVPTDIYFLTRHAIQVCESALDGFAVDIGRDQESQLLCAFH